MGLLEKIFGNGRNEVKEKEIVQEAGETSPPYKQGPIILADLLKGVGYEIKTVEKDTYMDVPRELQELQKSSGANANGT